MAAGGQGYDALIGTTLLAATPDEPEVAGTWTLVEREVLSVLMEEDDLGLLTPVFTSPEALARWRPEGGCYVERVAAWHFAVAAGDPAGRVVVDPGSPSAVVLGPVEVAALAADRSPTDTGDGGASMLIATPLDPLPGPVTDAVRAALAAEPPVRSARLFLIDQTGAGPQPVVLVDLEPDLDAASLAVLQEWIATAVAERTDEAGGLTFGLVTDEWRAVYDGGGLPLFAR